MKTNSTRDKILKKTEKYVREYLNGESSGHDWWHIFRVRNQALKIAEKEVGDLFLIEMAALLHDLDDWKISKSPDQKVVPEFLKKINVGRKEISQIVEIIEQVSFKGAGVITQATSPEAEIVQDADRLDAMGAIGIARAFAYGGNKGRLIYHPQLKPEYHENFEAYKNGAAPTINHFYEKLLLLKELLNTDTAKKMAQKRHGFMEVFLNQFFNEWENKI
ncbi:MAG TPA: HD domain-containing protein [Prolixibacteraceae bacterium]|nr:HD domain-containing protein [Prolixibacteraceae bacterium]